jgi:hypothetical protein
MSTAIPLTDRAKAIGRMFAIYQKAGGKWNARNPHNIMQHPLHWFCQEAFFHMHKTGGRLNEEFGSIVNDIDVQKLEGFFAPIVSQDDRTQFILAWIFERRNIDPERKGRDAPKVSM